MLRSLAICMNVTVLPVPVAMTSSVERTLACCASMAAMAAIW